MAKKLTLSEKRKLQKSGYWFTQKEVNYLVREAKKIGFKPTSRYTAKLRFDSKKIEDRITFEHIRTQECFSIEKYELKYKGLDIFKDNISDIFFTIIFEKHDMEMQGMHEQMQENY